jgi:acyl-CoA thioester hydrolase
VLAGSIGRSPIEVVQAGMRVERLGTSSVRYEVGLLARDEALACADGHFVHVFVDRVTRKPEPIPAIVRAALEAIRV